MAQTKISELTALGGSPAEDDLLPLVDTSANETKKMTVAELVGIIFPAPYIKTMTDNETFAVGHSLQRRGMYILDAGGAQRNFDPSGTFPAGFKAEIINTGDENLIFDSAGTAQVITPGGIGIFLFDGSQWR